MTVHKYIRGNLKAPKTSPVKAKPDDSIAPNEGRVDAPGPNGDKNREPKK